MTFFVIHSFICWFVVVVDAVVDDKNSDDTNNNNIYNSDFKIDSDRANWSRSRPPRLHKRPILPRPPEPPYSDLRYS